MTDSDTLNETLENPYGFRNIARSCSREQHVFENTSSNSPPTVQELLLGPSRTSPLDIELADAMDNENSLLGSDRLAFVSRVRELSLDALFECARPFLQETEEVTPVIGDPDSRIQNDRRISALHSDVESHGEVSKVDFEEKQIQDMSPADLESATDILRDQILSLSPAADDSLRTTLVQRLVLYRLKLQEIENAESETKSPLQTMGHDFQRVSPFRKLNRLGKHCEVCGQLVIFAPHQSICLSCGFVCHERCIKSISRQCVAEQVRINPEFILDICPEKGLDLQDFACAECKKPFPMHYPNVWDSHIRICEYNGLYYCTVCHQNDLDLVPGSVVKNWDFTLHNICRASYQTLSLLIYHPLLNLWELNKELFTQVEELACCQKLRSRLSILYRMMVDCKEGPQIGILHQLIPVNRKHLLSKTFMYSMNDLIDIERGVLLKELGSFAGELEKHVKITCSSCKKLRYSCVKCNDESDTMYPFEERALVCLRCSAVSHKKCSQENWSCIRCGYVEPVFS